MKFLVSQLMIYASNRRNRTNTMVLVRFLGWLAGLIALYSVLFHYIMAYEGRSESWSTGLYWTLTVMSTLGFGDITFHSDLGRIFSVAVLISGVVFLLILLPFTFIEFFYAPWIKAQKEASAPTQLPESTRDHVIIINHDNVTNALIEKLTHYKYPYVLLVPDLTQALLLHEQGYKVMRGDLGNPETYRMARANQALMVTSTANDQLNANIAFTVREVSETIPVVTTARSQASVDILYLAGCSRVLQLDEIMGQALARRVSDGYSTAHIIGKMDDLVIAEALARDTPLVGQTLRQSRLREKTGLNAVGMWERGQFSSAHPDRVINNNTVLVLASTAERIDSYNRHFHADTVHNAPVLVIGGGRVGKATCKALAERGLDYRIVEKDPSKIYQPGKTVVGDAADIHILEEAGIRDTAAVIITTHDDDMNIYLTIYCRKLRADVQIISRAGLEHNIATLHRAGADFIMSYASTGAHAIVNLIGRDNILMVAEGLNVFEVDIPDALVGKTIADTEIRSRTGCTLIALTEDDETHLIADPHEQLLAGNRLILLGTGEAERTFMELYKSDQ